MLAKHPDRCRFPHGHTRKVEIVLEADALDDREMVCDYKVIKESLAPFLHTLDHAMCMNTDDPQFAVFKERYGDQIIAFESEDPTTEVMARTIHGVCLERLNAYRQDGQGAYPLRAAVRIASVRVWETSSTWAEYCA